MTRQLRIMPLGDSITYGYASTDGGGYLTQLSARLSDLGASFAFVGSQTSAGFANEGHVGYRIDQVDGGISVWIPAQVPVDVVLLLIGTNDCVQELTGAASRMSTLLTDIAVLAPAATVLVSTLPPLNPATVGMPATAPSLRTELNAALTATVAAHATATLVDAGGSLVIADISSDGAHPTDAGYTKLGNAWYDALLPTVLAVQPPASIDLYLADTQERITLAARTLP